MTDLTERIFLDFTYAPGFTTLTTPLDDVLTFRRGVCQDFAHVAIGCLRSMGLAARYVSGYIETLPPPGEERMVGADASHAWPSVFVPGWGWFDIDPTNDQLVGSRYITTAWGAIIRTSRPSRASSSEGAAPSRSMCRWTSPVPSPCQGDGNKSAGRQHLGTRRRSARRPYRATNGSC